MSSLCNRAAGRAKLAACILGAVLTHRAGAADAVLQVCVDQANPTSAMDARVARAAAETQGYEINQVPFLGYGKGGDGFPPSRFAKMAQSDCELVLGFPVDVSAPNLPPNVEATAAYASTGFVLVRRGAAQQMSLDDLPRGSEVGIAQLDTYAGVLYSSHPNIVMHVYEKDSLMLQDLVAKHIAAGMAWQPSIESYESGRVKFAPLSVHILPGKHMLWNLVALYVPRAQNAADLFDQGIQELRAQGRLERLIKPYGLATAAGAAAKPAAPVSNGAAGQGSAPRLQDAVAWSDAGGLIRVADSNAAAAGAPHQRHGKPPSLYTTDQATKGALAYYKNCAMCHGPNLDGQSAGYSGPALKGADFADPSYDFHVDDIFNFVAKQMPAATPGSLSHEEDVQIMAFILQQNGYPAGNDELKYDAAEKSRVPIRYYGK